MSKSLIWQHELTPTNECEVEFPLLNIQIFDLVNINLSDNPICNLVIFAHYMDLYYILDYYRISEI